MALALRVLLDGVGARDRAVAEELAFIFLDRRVRRLERLEGHEAEAARVARLAVAHDLRRGDDDAKGGEGVVQQLLVDLGVEVADEDVGAHIEHLLVARRLVDADRLAEHLHHVEHLDRVLRVLLALELDEAEAHVHLRQLVLRHVHVHHRPALHAQLPEQRLGHLRVEVADVAGGLLVAVEGVVGHGDERGFSGDERGLSASSRACQRVRETAGRAENLRGRGDEERVRAHDEPAARADLAPFVAWPLLPVAAAAALVLDAAMGKILSAGEGLASVRAKVRRGGGGGGQGRLAAPRRASTEGPRRGRAACATLSKCANAVETNRLRRAPQAPVNFHLQKFAKAFKR